VGGGERRGEPQAERPRGRQRGPTGERGVLAEYLRRRRAVDHEVLERLAGDAELHARDVLRADLERDAAGVVDEHAVAARGEIERNVLVGELAARAAVLVPDVDRLAVLDQRTEPFAEAIDGLADAERELRVHVRAA